MKHVYRFILMFIVSTISLNMNKALAEANYVYHEQTANNPGCGGAYLSPIPTLFGSPITVRFKVEFQFYTDNVRLYYTTNGTNPSGSYGTPTGATQVVVATYECSFGGPVVDVAKAIIPAQPEGTTVKYIVSAWYSGGGNEIFANGPGTPCSCGPPTNSSSLATVFTLNTPLPVQLSSFTGTLVNNRVKLDWSTISEVNNYGFYTQKRSVGVMEWSEVPNSFVAGHGTTNAPQHYTFTDNSAFTGTTEYRLKQVDLDGSIHFTDPIQVESPTAVKELAPIEFALKQNYPNPFNPETNIKFSVETAGRATLELYNMLGQKVATLFDDVVETGLYQTVKFNASNLASGMYIFRLESGSKNQMRKMLLLK